MEGKMDKILQQQHKDFLEKEEKFEEKIREQQKEIMEKEEVVNELKQELKRRISTAEYYRKKCSVASSKANSICKSLEIYLSKMYPGKHSATKAKL